MTNHIVVFLVIVLVSILGFLANALTRSGSIAAIIIGISVYAGFDIRGLTLLGVFFATSSLWSKYRSGAKKAIDEKLAKGGSRDWQQVVANGGLPGLMSLNSISDDSHLWLLLFSTAIASANSDTWASELGSLSKRKPISVRSFKRVDKGTSGAISLFGTFAAICGSLLIALVAGWLFALSTLDVFTIFIFGFTGNIIDTILGASFQQVYLCESCGLETEKKKHCGSKNVKIRGWNFLDNDTVNFLSSLIALIMAYLVLTFFL